MTAGESTQLAQLFGELNDKIDKRFDAVDQRLTLVETGIATKAAEEAGKAAARAEMAAQRAARTGRVEFLIRNTGTLVAIVVAVLALIRP